jgi:hypothetical protein
MMHIQGGYKDLCSAWCNRAMSMARWYLWLAVEGRSQARILGCLYIAAGGWREGALKNGNPALLTVVWTRDPG